MKKCDYCDSELTYKAGYFACPDCGEYKQSINNGLDEKQILSILFKKKKKKIKGTLLVIGYLKKQKAPIKS